MAMVMAMVRPLGRCCHGCFPVTSPRHHPPRRWLNPSQLASSARLDTTKIPVSLEEPKKKKGGGGTYFNEHNFQRFGRRSSGRLLRLQLRKPFLFTFYISVAIMSVGEWFIFGEDPRGGLLDDCNHVMAAARVNEVAEKKTLSLYLA